MHYLTVFDTETNKMHILQYCAFCFVVVSKIIKMGVFCVTMFLISVALILMYLCLC